jgi:hypothetical protein
MDNQDVEKKDESAEEPKKWWILVLRANWVILLVIVIAIAGSGAALYASDTNPEFCAVCHNMQGHVDSYLNSNHMDNVHAQANVGCKDCHDYPIPAEVESLVRYVTGAYDKNMPRRKFDQEMCLKCHISLEYQANRTDFLVRNPHLSHWPDVPCGTCHISHGEQVDYCGQCHDNGGQRMTGGEIIPRAENPWAE